MRKIFSFPVHVDTKEKKVDFIKAALKGELYGNSMSYTIRHMAENNIPTWCVKAIISSTHMLTRKQFREVIESYSGITWGGFEKDPKMIKKCQKIAWKLWNAGKIIQPRVILKNEYSPAGNSWNCLCQDNIHLDTLHNLVEYREEEVYSEEQKRYLGEPNRGLRHNRWLVERLMAKNLI